MCAVCGILLLLPLCASECVSCLFIYSPFTAVYQSLSLYAWGCMWYTLQYFTPGSGTEVNIDGATRAALSARIASGYADPHMFDSVAEVCEKELAGDVMPKFVKSGEWRALCGMDPLMGTPLLPAPTPPPITPKSPTAPPEAMYV